MIKQVPLFWKNKIASQYKCTVVNPQHNIFFNGSDVNIYNCNSKDFYSILISDKVRLPKGMVNWCLEYELSHLQIVTSFTFAKECTSSIFNRVFQYKISTNILPTNKYLEKYKVKSEDTCHNCLVECDSNIHRLYDCIKVVPIISYIFAYLIENCQAINKINMLDFLFGIPGQSNKGVNHVLLELKKKLFYSLLTDSNPLIFSEEFKNDIIYIMIKEKEIAIKKGCVLDFYAKWENLIYIYDFRGPDLIII